LYSALLQQHEEDKIVFFFFFFSPLCRSKASSIHVYPTIPYLPCLAIAREAGPGLPCPTIAKKKDKNKKASFVRVCLGLPLPERSRASSVLLVCPTMTREKKGKLYMVGFPNLEANVSNETHEKVLPTITNVIFLKLPSSTQITMEECLMDQKKGLKLSYKVEKCKETYVAKWILNALLKKVHEPLLKMATLGTFELVKGAPNVKII
jgi:hypothetical protein